MTVLCGKHRPVASPALAPTQLGEADAFDNRQQAADTALTIGLINSMPDSALQATERKFTRLLQAEAGNRHIDLHYFSLPSVKRSEQTQQLMHGRYRDIADLDRLRFDGVIVTDAAPNAAALREEPFWNDLVAIVDWAKINTRSAIWSCLAAHAAVLHLDGIERQLLDEKCSGVYDCFKVIDDRLTQDVASPLKIAHSRLHALRRSDLAANGYQILTESPDAGVDIFVKQLRSRFVFFQGYPEYEALSLQREYLRDITRYLSRQRDRFPDTPAHYFDQETEKKLAHYRKRAVAERTIPLSIELPRLTLRPGLASGEAASSIFRNWLEYLSEGVKPTAEASHRR
ncbi:homoserine O-succinyltransferase [Bradyrhizobium sp. dw_78]|uniref:homoserine O-succinyltransferase MetA n=1 Tax=Bradyrhizobium sp. dw_78 TaxID=2719793 RepID=UPI001BD33A23|nr:homoserine O-succinyltransferase [Bradyrhizobium sp. dw_78]